MNPIIRLLLRPVVSSKEIYSALGMSKETFRQKIYPLRAFINGDSIRKRMYTQDEFRFLIDNIKFEKVKPKKKRK